MWKKTYFFIFIMNKKYKQTRKKQGNQIDNCINRTAEMLRETEDKKSVVDGVIKSNSSRHDLNKVIIKMNCYFSHSTFNGNEWNFRILSILQTSLFLSIKIIYGNCPVYTFCNFVRSMTSRFGNFHGNGH